MRRVVVTGMGVVSPLGVDLKENFEKVTAGRSVVSKIESFDVTEYASQIAAQVPFGDEAGQFNPDLWIAPKEQRHMDKFVIYGIAAGLQALADSGFTAESEDEKNRSGVLVGSGIGGIGTIYTTAHTIRDAGPRRVSPFFIPSSLANMISGHLSMRSGFQGPNSCVVTACATGTHAIGDAARLIRCDEADVMLAGGAESAVSPMTLSGFGQARALSTHYNDKPQEASRPWDKGRDGFVVGEGAAVLVLEEYEHAKKRGAKIYGEIIGYGMSSDAYHITMPGNNGGLRAMRLALKQAGLNAADIGYINAHGTSTPAGDMVELSAIKELYGADIDKVSISSTKSTIGHLLGAAGAIEAVYCLQALNAGILPPTVNLNDPDEGCEGVDLVPNKAKEKQIKYALSNSFGFGGTNGSLIFAKV